MGWGEQDVVVAVAIHTGVDVVDEAAVAAVLEDVKEVIAVKAVGEACQDLALTDAIADAEAGRDFSAKTNIGELLNIHEDDES